MKEFNGKYKGSILIVIVIVPHSLPVIDSMEWRFCSSLEFSATSVVIPAIPEIPAILYHTSYLSFFLHG